jgi:hypothetical protein
MCAALGEELHHANTNTVFWHLLVPFHCEGPNDMQRGAE